MRYDTRTRGIYIKITRGVNGLYDHSLQLNFAYAFDQPGSTVHYGISVVFGDPLAGHSVVVTGTGNYLVIYWPTGVAPSDNPSKASSSTNGFYYMLC